MDNNNDNRLKLPFQRRPHNLNGRFNNNDTNHHHLPPPQQQPPPYYHRHSSSSASFKGCCCCLFLLMSFLLLLAIFLIIILAIKQKKSEFDLNQVGVQYIGTTQMEPATSATTAAEATITLTIHLMFTADNPNAVGIKYGESKFTVMYRGMTLGKAVVSGFYRSAHKQRLPSSFLARTIAIPCRLSLSSRPTHSRPPKSPLAITTVPSYVVAAASPHNPKTETRRPRRDSRHTPTDAGSPPLSPY
ncbi:hypothetical protein ACFE04_005770 [Oxalis oulophora]